MPPQPLSPKRRPVPGLPRRRAETFAYPRAEQRISDLTVSDPSILPSGSITGDHLFITFDRRDDSEGLVNQTFQYGSTLSSWTDIVIGATSGALYTVDELGAAPDLFTVTLTISGAPKTFARLLVSEVGP